MPGIDEPCQVGSGALIPLEVCEVPPGQIMRKQVPPEKTKDVLDFSTKKPVDRLNSIKNGLGVINSFTFFRFKRHLKYSTDPAMGPVGIRQAVRPQGQSERATAATPGQGVTTSDTQVWAGIKATDHRKCDPLLFISE